MVKNAQLLCLDPSFVLEYELNPMCRKYGCDMVANMSSRTKHNPIWTEGYVPTLHLFAFFEEIQSV